MAGNMYRTGQQAVTELRETYAQSRIRSSDGYEGQHHMHIPGAFPDVAITVQGGEQMVLFPSYAKKHAKRDWSRDPTHQSQVPQGSVRDEGYWRQEWERNEDEKATVDVDVRGWIYAPNTGPMTRRNRILIGLARQLSGISAPRGDVEPRPAAPPTPHQVREELREQEKIDREAARIDRLGREEKNAAVRGDYSENPPESDYDTEPVNSFKSRRGSYATDSAPSSPMMSPSLRASPSFLGRQNTGANEMTEAQLVVANSNLMARVAPFMTNPLVALPVTVFFYNDTNSQSRTVMTNDAGHFNMRAALDFAPTHVRILANEKLSATQEVKITAPRGVSIISDIDDTIKRSNISGGTREIFRNTFIRDLADLTVEGVKEWYNQMHDLGVNFHYCSNSPWQMFPVLASFFKMDGLPPGSLHLKQYSGMLQGIFEPVAERKKSTLNRLLRDFPQRKFLLVGDSGEADLEVYTELALANPGRILALFIRDVTTPETLGYFESVFDMRRKTSSLQADDARPTGSSSLRQKSAPPTPAPAAEQKTPTGPIMGTLFDFSEEPEEAKLDDAAALNQLKDMKWARRPPPRPSKPIALRSAASKIQPGDAVGLGVSQKTAQNSSEATLVPPVKPPRPAALDKDLPHPLAQMQNSSQQNVGSNSATPKATTPATAKDDAAHHQHPPPPPMPPRPATTEDRPPPPPPRRRMGPNTMSPSLFQHHRRGTGSLSNSDIDFDPLPPPVSGPQPSAAATARSSSSMYSRTPATTPPLGSPTMGATANKKLDMWRRRLVRAQDQLDRAGVALYTWRKGQDVAEEALGLIRGALEQMERGEGDRPGAKK